MEIEVTLSVTGCANALARSRCGLATGSWPSRKRTDGSKSMPLFRTGCAGMRPARQAGRMLLVDYGGTMEHGYTT